MEVGTAKIHPPQVDFCEISIAEGDLGDDMLVAPSVPNLESLPEDGELFLVRHSLRPACGCQLRSP
jgi:hypothetical protein